LLFSTRSFIRTVLLQRRGLLFVNNFAKIRSPREQGPPTLQYIICCIALYPEVPRDKRPPPRPSVKGLFDSETSPHVSAINPYKFAVLIFTVSPRLRTCPRSAFKRIANCQTARHNLPRARVPFDDKKKTNLIIGVFLSFIFHFFILLSFGAWPA